MPTTLLKIFLSALLLSPFTHSFAQDTFGKQVATVWSVDIQKRLYSNAVSLNNNNPDKEACKNSGRLDLVSFGVLQNIEYSKSTGHPVKGMWTVRYRFDCTGNPVIYNALIQAQAESTPVIVPLVPGTTITSPILMRDTYLPVVIAAALKNKDSDECAKKAVIQNTSVTVEPQTLRIGNDEFEKAWEEEWIVKTCSAPVAVSICFLPTKSAGTSIVIATCQDNKTIQAYLSRGAQNKGAPQ